MFDVGNSVSGAPSARLPRIRAERVCRTPQRDHSMLALATHLALPVPAVFRGCNLVRLTRPARSVYNVGMPRSPPHGGAGLEISHARVRASPHVGHALPQDGAMLCGARFRCRCGTPASEPRTPVPQQTMLGRDPSNTSRERERNAMATDGPGPHAMVPPRIAIRDQSAGKNSPDRFGMRQAYDGDVMYRKDGRDGRPHVM